MIAIAEVGTLERRKRLVSPSEPEFPDLAREVRVAAERVLELSRAEEATAQKVTRESGGAGMPPIERIHPARTCADPRGVERRRAASPGSAPGSDEAEALAREFEALRQRYADALAERTERLSAPTSAQRSVPRSGLAFVRRAHHADRTVGAVLQVEHHDHIRETAGRRRRGHHETVGEVLRVDMRRVGRGDAPVRADRGRSRRSLPRSGSGAARKRQAAPRGSRR